MTPQEIQWQGKWIKVSTTAAKSGRVHPYVSRYMDCTGHVLREAKNGMLLVHFWYTPFGLYQDRASHIRAIPAGCVVDISVC